jgi:hypothetical protein
MKPRQTSIPRGSKNRKQLPNEVKRLTVNKSDAQSADQSSSFMYSKEYEAVLGHRD